MSFSYNMQVEGNRWWQKVKEINTEVYKVTDHSWISHTLQSPLKYKRWLLENKATRQKTQKDHS